MTRAWLARCAFAVASLAGCDVDDPAPTPTCAALGCPDAPSGSPEHWEPCAADECYCPTDDGEALACARGDS